MQPPGGLREHRATDAVTSVSNEGMETGSEQTRRAEVPVTACVPRPWRPSSATRRGLAWRLWHRPPRAGPQRPRGIPAVTDMLHYGYYLAVWPRGVRRRGGGVSGFVVFQGSEEAFMWQRRGSKQPPLACPLPRLFVLLALSSLEPWTQRWTSEQMAMQPRGPRWADPFRRLVLRRADKEQTGNVAPYLAPLEI